MTQFKDRIKSLPAIDLKEIARVLENSEHSKDERKEDAKKIRLILDEVLNRFCCKYKKTEVTVEQYINDKYRLHTNPDEKYYIAHLVFKITVITYYLVETSKI